jgi:hypothetical protein
MGAAAAASRPQRAPPQRSRRRLLARPRRASGRRGGRLPGLSRKGMGGFRRSLQQQLGELLGRVGEGEALAWAVVEFVGDGVELRLADGAEVGALREVLAQQAVGVLVGAALPRGMGIAEEDLDVPCESLPGAAGDARIRVRCGRVGIDRGYARIPACAGVASNRSFSQSQMRVPGFRGHASLRLADVGAPACGDRAE